MKFNQFYSQPKKTVIYVLIIFAVLVVLILILSGVFSKKKTTGQPTTGQEETSQTSQDTSGGVFSPKVAESVLPTPIIDAALAKTSKEEKVKLTSTNALPIYLQNVKTSSGLTTTINIFSSEYDPEYTVRLEIYGVNYYIDEAADSNPNYVAFKESLNRVTSTLRQKGVDPSKLVYIFYSREPMASVANYWAKEVGFIKY